LREEGGIRCAVEIRLIKGDLYMVYFIVLLVALAIGFGWWKSEDFEIAIEVNTFTGPSFTIGVISARYYTSEEIQDEITIGLFFVNFVFTFFKPLEDFEP